MNFNLTINALAGKRHRIRKTLWGFSKTRVIAFGIAFVEFYGNSMKNSR